MAALVTVAIPTYNRAGYLGSAIESVLGQTLQDFEVVVLDNASTDDTEAVVRAFADPRIAHDRAESNLGPHGNFNRCLAAGTAPLLAILQDDDLMLPRNLELKAALLERHRGLAVATALLRFLDAEGRLIQDDVDWWEAPTERESGSEFVARTMRKGLRIELSSALMRRELLPAGGFDPRDGMATDYGFFLRLAIEGGAGFLRETLSASRRHEASLSVSTEAIIEAGGHYAPSLEYIGRCREINERFLDENAPRLPDTARLRRDARRWARSQLAGAVRAGAGKEPQLSRTLELLKRAAREDARVLATPRVLAVLAWSSLGRRGRNLARRLLPRLSSR